MIAMIAIQHITIIYNPASTGGSMPAAQALYASIRQELPHLSIEMAPTKYRGHAGDLAEIIAHNRPGTLLVAAGGDGTYHEVVNGIMQQPASKRPLCALLPTGNANDHHRALSPERSMIERIKDPQVLAVELLKLVVFNPHGGDIQRYAHSYIGFGTSGQAAQSLNDSDRGGWSEKLIVLRELLRPRSFELVRGGHVKHLYSVLCSNVEVMAKHLTVHQDADLNDGRFAVTEISASSRAQLLRQVARSVRGNPPTPETTTKYSCMLLTDVQAQLDGETAWLTPGSTLTVTVEHNALKTLI